MIASGPAPRSGLTGRGWHEQSESPQSSDDLPTSRRRSLAWSRACGCARPTGEMPRESGGETVSSPATSATDALDLPEYVPVPAIAKGAALNEHGYHVWQV